MRSRGVRAAILILTSALVVSAVPPSARAAGAQNDARTRRDAGDTFDAATRVRPRGLYAGRLDAAGGDTHDYYRFFLAKGESVSVLVRAAAAQIDPVTLLDPSGVPVDVATRVASRNASVSGVLTMPAPGVSDFEPPDMRLAVHGAAVAGYYRLHLQSEMSELGDYWLCFMNCETSRFAPQDLFADGSLRHTLTRVLVVPPSHGDLGNPRGPSVTDYVDATLRGIRGWTRAIKKFSRDYPRFAYLRKIKVKIEVFDELDPVDPAGYDIVVAYVAAGAAFRGLAGDFDDGFVESTLADAGLGEDVRFSGRFIFLSLFSSSPRAGQVLYDFPEINDLENVTLHEFGHTFGLGHTLTWHPVLGPDLMNSPATFVYGDGSPVGDGGERTKPDCISSLNLFALAHLYRWVPSGRWVPSSGRVGLPADIPYKWYC